MSRYDRSFRFLLHSRHICTRAVIAIGLAIAGQAARAESATNVDDGWRRTVDGWERVESWQNDTVDDRAEYWEHARPDASNSGVRFDSHPVVLAFMQVVAIVSAYFFWPARRLVYATKATNNGRKNSLVARAA